MHGSEIILPLIICFGHPPGIGKVGEQMPGNLSFRSAGMQSPWHSPSSEHAFPSSVVLTAQK